MSDLAKSLIVVVAAAGLTGLVAYGALGSDVRTNAKKNEKQDERIERVEDNQRKITRQLDWQSGVLYGIAEKLDVPTPPAPPQVQ